MIIELLAYSAKNLVFGRMGRFPSGSGTGLTNLGGKCLRIVAGRPSCCLVVEALAFGNASRSGESSTFGYYLT